MAVLSTVLDRLESDQALLDIREPTSQHLVWPFLRYDVLFYLTYKQQGFDFSPPRHQASLIEKIRSLLFSCCANPFLIGFKKKRNILIFNSGITNIRNDNGKYFNKFADYFYQQFPTDSFLVEETAYAKHSLPRAHHSVYSSLFIRMAAKFISLFFLRNSKSLNLLAKQICQGLHEKLSGIVYDRSALEEIVVFKLNGFRRVKAEQWIYLKLLRFIRPRIILVEDACYGSRAHLIFAARRLGIKVAEYQHGFISERHLAYNYGKAVDRHSYKEYLPDYFLSFGEFWSKTIALPSTKIVIGNPHLDQCLKKLKTKQKENILLILGSGINAPALIPVVIELSQHACALGMNTLFRPHPSEWPNAEQIYAALGSHRVSLDINTDLYQSVQRAEVVCAEISTTVYEAMAFTTEVYLIPTAYSTTFSNGASEFLPDIYHWLSRNTRRETLGADYVWARGWEENYRAFIIGVLRSAS